MQLSISVNISDIVEYKKNIFELLISRPGIFFKKNIKDVISIMKNSGIKGLELVLLKNTSTADISKVKEFSKRYDLPILSLHQPVINLNIKKEDIEKLFFYGSILKVKVIVIHIRAIIQLLADKNFILFIKDAQKKNKILMGVENLPITPLNFFNTTTYKTRGFSELISTSGLHITFDTTHLAQAGEDIEKFYKINMKSIVNIHLSNYVKGFIGKEHTILTNGSLKIARFLQVLNDSSYDKLLTLEINDSLPHIIESLKQIEITNYL